MANFGVEKKLLELKRLYIKKNIQLGFSLKIELPSFLALLETFIAQLGWNSSLMPRYI